MRALLLVLLILFLPIRGWSTERMAVYMATGAAVSTMPEDCPMQIRATGTEQNAAHLDSPPGGTCQVCQLCMSWAYQETPAPEATCQAVRSHDETVADRFTSIDLERLSKPPIY